MDLLNNPVNVDWINNPASPFNLPESCVEVGSQIGWIVFGLIASAIIIRVVIDKVANR